MNLIGALFGIGKQVIDDLFPGAENKQKRLEAELAFRTKIMESEASITRAAASIVEAEAKSTHVLAATWRPITMLTFVALIVCRMFGLTNDAVSDAEYTMLWEIVKLGLGGYVVGRSGEKIAKALRKNENQTRP